MPSTGSTTGSYAELCAHPRFALASPSMRFDRGTCLALGLLCSIPAGCATVPKVSAKPKTGKPPPEAPPPTVEEVLAKIEHAAAAEVKAKHWPSLAIGVVADGTLRWWKGYGEIDAFSHAPVTDKTYFRYGSISKIFAGLSLLQLRDTGKLSLDDPLEKFIPEVKGVVYPTPERPPIRLVHLVTHTSALPRVPTGIDYTDPKHVLTEAELLAVLPGMTLDGTPGAFEGYSNYANCLSGVVVHRVTGMPYEDWLLSHIAAPLGLGLRWTQETVPPGLLAMGHSPAPNGQPGLVEVPRSWVLGACNSAGGLFGSLDDLAGFAAFELSAWPPREGPESAVASRATLRESQQPHGKEFGVNWGYAQSPELGYVLGHSGEVAGYSAVLRMNPERGIAVIGLLGFDEGVDDLGRLTRSALIDLERAYPTRPPDLGPTMRSKVEALVRLFEPDAGKVPEELFTPEFVKFMHGTLDDFFGRVRESGGHCRQSKVIWGNVNAAKVEFACGRGNLNVTVYLQSAAPHAIGGFGVVTAP
jgi:CubicO group peptidase (beta-lactamase class C family)